MYINPCMPSTQPIPGYCDSWIYPSLYVCGVRVSRGFLQVEEELTCDPQCFLHPQKPWVPQTFNDPRRRAGSVKTTTICHSWMVALEIVACNTLAYDNHYPWLAPRKSTPKYLSKALCAFSHVSAELKATATCQTPKTAVSGRRFRPGTFECIAWGCLPG